MKKNLLGISMITITGLYVLLAAIIIGVTILTGFPILYGILLSIVILIIQFLISPFITDLSMRWFYKVNFNNDIPDYLKVFIEDICKKENMKYPKVGVIDDGAPNAFTYGHTKNDARIVITRGILELLNEEEAIAVVGHELGHAVHYDMLFMTVAQLVPLIMYAIYEAFRDANTSDDDNNYGALISLIAYILYVISNYIVLWLSRTREYYADSYSVEATKNPNSLASALVKIGYGLTTAKTNAKHSASKSNALGIFDSKASKSLVVSSYQDGTISKENIKQAMKWEQWNLWAKWFEFNSTHPLISKRLLAISSRSTEYNQEPFIVFDLKPEESYVDDFFLEVLISFGPLFVLIIGLILALVFNSHALICLACTFMAIVLTGFIKFKRQHPTSNYKPSTVRSLLSEVKVSGITAIPCTLEGEVIGRGDPGYIFNEDMTIQDETGIIFLDYNQPLFIVNKIYALFKNQENIGKKIKVVGWYRRSPVPYVEIKSYEIEGVTKNIFTYPLNLFLFGVLFVLGIVFIILTI